MRPFQPGSGGADRARRGARDSQGRVVIVGPAIKIAFVPLGIAILANPSAGPITGILNALQAQTGQVVTVVYGRGLCATHRRDDDLSQTAGPEGPVASRRVIISYLNRENRLKVARTMSASPQHPTAR